jgi:hypothetical protein
MTTTALQQKRSVLYAVRAKMLYEWDRVSEELVSELQDCCSSVAVRSR